MKQGLIALLTLIMVITGCGGDKSAAPEGVTATPSEDKKLVIGVMPKLVGIDYFNAAERGAVEAAKELGVELVYDGPSTNDVQQQSRMVETWITKKFDAIAVAPNDPDAIGVVLKKARKRNAKVLSWDADSVQESRDFFVNQASNEAIARVLIETMAKNIGPEGKYIILTGSLSASNQNIWMGEMEKYRAEHYPNMVNLSPTPKATEEDFALATQVTLDVLKTYPDLNGIFAITSVALPGAAEALRKANAADRVFLTGLATPTSMREFILDDTCREVILWNVPDLGYLTVHAAVAMARGELKAGDTTFNAGRLGSIEIQGDQILLGDPIAFNKSNIMDVDY